MWRTLSSIWPVPRASMLLFLCCSCGFLIFLCYCVYLVILRILRHAQRLCIQTGASCNFNVSKRALTTHHWQLINRILAHLLHNEFISSKIKRRLKRAAKYGRVNEGQCKMKYPCERVLLRHHQAIRHQRARRREQTRQDNSSKSKKRKS